VTAVAPRGKLHQASTCVSRTIRAEVRTKDHIVAALFDRLFWGADAPRGDGRLVAVLPGLFGGDLYLEPLRGWLRRIGYLPVRSTLAINAGCPQRLREQVQAEIERRLNRTDRPIALIGHSRGGLLAWSIASAMQARVSHLALLGSPLGVFQRALGSGANPSPRTPASAILARASNLARQFLDPACDAPACGCAFISDVQRTLDPATAVLQVISRDDRVVTPEAARVAAGQIVEVEGGHIGLVYSTRVYRTLGDFLATKAG
jgi:pimeloyl-ACP methyl ester carboxylesterase